MEDIRLGASATDSKQHLEEVFICGLDVGWVSLASAGQRGAPIKKKGAQRDVFNKNSGWVRSQFWARCRATALSREVRPLTPLPHSL